MGNKFKHVKYDLDDVKQYLVDCGWHRVPRDFAMWDAYYTIIARTRLAVIIPKNRESILSDVTISRCLGDYFELHRDIEIDYIAVITGETSAEVKRKIEEISKGRWKYGI